MLYDFGSETLHSADRVTLKTARLTLRPPLASDAKAIARLANDRRIAENLRRLPHPYSRDDAEAYLNTLAAEDQERVLLIEAEVTMCLEEGQRFLVRGGTRHDQER